MINAPRALPQEPQAAILALIDITERLCTLMEDESRAIAMSDKVLFITANQDKQKLADLYEQGAREFKHRVEDFRTVSKALIDRLEEAQQRLGELTRANVDLLETAATGNA
jgi:hypothetical protein